MKKLLSLLLVVILLLSFTACKRNHPEDEALAIPNVTENLPEEQKDNEETKQQNESTEKETENTVTNDEQKISGSITTSCGTTTPDETQTEQPKEQKLLGVFPDSLSDSDRQKLNDIANSKKPVATVSKSPEEFSNYRFYYQANAKELIELLASFEYTGDICRCGADNVVYIGENLEFNFFLKRNEESGNYESVEHGGTSYQLTAEQGKKLTQLVENLFDEKNYKSVKGKENQLEFIQRKDNSFVRYSFKNADADRLIYLFYNIEKTEPIMTEDIDYRFEGMFMRLALDCEKPYVTGRNNSAYLTAAQLKEIKDILSRNCNEQNIKEYPDETMPVFVKDLKDESKLYSFTNDASAFLINYIMFYSYSDQNVSCTCQKEYNVYSHFYIYKQKNKEIVKDEYNIGFVDGIAHITRTGDIHMVLSEKDSKYIQQIINTYCTAQTLVSK